MPRDKPHWNSLIGKGVDALQGRDPGRSLATSAVQTSQVAPVLQTSNLAESTQSTSNILATSVAINRTREHLHQALVQSEDDGEIYCTPDPVVIDYIDKIEQYTNHKLPDTLPRYPLSSTDWQKVCWAAKAAKAIQKMARSSEAIQFIPGSTFGIFKAFTISTHNHDEAQSLVVAIRASRSADWMPSNWIPWDWMVNMNSEPAECKELGDQVKCHKGFLSVAQNMKAFVENSIIEHVSKLGRPTNIILTGHSSGAAVAQLLFSLHHSDPAVLKGPNVGQIDCITFGGPPISSPSLPKQPPCLFLDLKNEGDPVTLAQPEYIQSLLEAYTLNPPRTPSEWKVPRPVFHSSGDQILLRDAGEDEDESDAEEPGAFQVDDDKMNSVLFGNPLRHSMLLYLTRVEAIHHQSVNGDLS